VLALGSFRHRGSVIPPNADPTRQRIAPCRDHHAGVHCLSDEPVWLVVIQGRFSVERSWSPRDVAEGSRGRIDVLPFLFLVVDQGTGQIVDSGARSTYPDLSALGLVVTDLSAGPPRQL
jgi:hypothetical protein